MVQSHTPLVGKLCLIKELMGGQVMIVGSMEPGPGPGPCPSFVQALLDSNDQWMWNNIETTGDMNWLSTAISSGSAVAVTDGSYMEVIYPNSAPLLLLLSVGKAVVKFSARSSNVRRTPARIKVR